MFQVNSNRTMSTDVVLVSFLLQFWTDSTPYTSVFTVHFEHIIAGLVCMVFETNLLTSQYAVYSEIPFNRIYVIEELAKSFYNAIQITGMVLLTHSPEYFRWF